MLCSWTRCSHVKQLKLLDAKFPTLPTSEKTSWHQRSTKVTAATSYTAFPVCFSSSIHPHFPSLTHSPVCPSQYSKQQKEAVEHGTSARFLCFSFSIWEHETLDFLTRRSCSCSSAASLPSVTVNLALHLFSKKSSQGSKMINYSTTKEPTANKLNTETKLKAAEQSAVNVELLSSPKQASSLHSQPLKLEITWI